MSLYFCSVLPFSKNKEAGRGPSFALCWCVIREAKEVVNLALKRNSLIFLVMHLLSYF